MNVDKKFLRSVAEIVREYDLSEITVKEEGLFEVTVKRSAVSAPATTVPAATVAPAAEVVHASVDDTRYDYIDSHEIKSPMVGVFYSAPAPGEAPFVSEGDSVSEGDVLCIIEAMKIMNEIKADKSGKIVQICCSDGELVEFGQTIFKIK